MPRPILIAGASGAGKTFLLKNIMDLDSRIVSVKKLTTRGPRQYENEKTQYFLDLKFNCSKNRVNDCDYVYNYADVLYGVNKSEINKVLKEGKNPVLIIRNGDIIQKIKKDYPNALTLYLQSVLSGNDLKNKLKEQGRDDLEIKDRMQRIHKDFYDYINHLRSRVFDYVIINFYEHETLMEQVQYVLANELPKVDPNFIFVIMSFNPEHDESYRALSNAGKLISNKNLRVERIDQKPGDYRITDEVLKCIENAALIVCDLTEERPNVYYELGYARGIEKDVIHCAKVGTKLHFDIKDFHTVFYHTPMDLQEKMVKEYKYYFAK